MNTTLTQTTQELVKSYGGLIGLANTHMDDDVRDHLIDQAGDIQREIASRKVSGANDLLAVMTQLRIHLAEDAEGSTYGYDHDKLKMLDNCLEFLKGKVN